MVCVRKSPFASASIAAGIVLVVAGGLACQSADAANVASGMKAKMKLPVQIDDDTRLDDVRAISKKELGYFLTLTRMTKAQADANSGFANLLESTLRGGACQNPSYQTIFKAGLSLRMTYVSSDQVEVRTIVMTPKDCGL
jgi:hypothetical protein